MKSESNSVVSNSWAVQSMEFSRPGYLPNPGIESRSSAFQADSLPAEPQRKPTFLSGPIEPMTVTSDIERAGFAIKTALFNL